MKLIKINSNILIIFFIILIIFISYINYFLYGGFGSGDDISILLENNENLTIKNVLLGLTQGSPARPMSSTILEIIIYFANNNPKFYIICCIFSTFTKISLRAKKSDPIGILFFCNSTKYLSLKES